MIRAGSRLRSDVRLAATRLDRLHIMAGDISLESPTEDHPQALWRYCGRKCSIFCTLDDETSSASATELKVVQVSVVRTEALEVAVCCVDDLPQKVSHAGMLCIVVVAR